MIFMQAPVPPFGRQRINKNGNQVIPQNTRTALTNWTSDGTYPATINAHRLQVSGAGNVTVTWAASRISSSGFGSAMDCYLMRNGVQVDSFTMAIGVTSGSDTWTGSVANGDLLHIEVESAVSTQNHRTMTPAGTHIDLNPN